MSSETSRLISLGQKLVASKSPSDNALGNTHSQRDLVDNERGTGERYMSGMPVCVRVVKNVGLTPLEPGSGVKPSSSGMPYLVEQAAAGDAVTGVVDHKLTVNVLPGETFCIIEEGPGSVLVSAAVAQGALLQVGAAGDFATSAGPVAPNIPARAMAAAAGAGLVRAYINCKAAI